MKANYHKFTITVRDYVRNLDYAFSESTSCGKVKGAGASWFSTHLWASVTGSGHAVREVEEECLVSSLETVARGRREEETRDRQVFKERL